MMVIENKHYHLRIKDIIFKHPVIFNLWQFFETHIITLFPPKPLKSIGSSTFWSLNLWMVSIFHMRSQIWGGLKIGVATLALGSQPRWRLAKVQAKNEAQSHTSCSQECRRVWGNKPTHSQMSSHFGSWSLDGLPNS